LPFLEFCKRSDGRGALGLYNARPLPVADVKNKMITIEAGYLQNLFDLVVAMINDLAPIEMGIFSILIFTLLVRQILHWIKIMKYV
jgi:hypothetical protein